MERRSWKGHRVIKVLREEVDAHVDADMSLGPSKQSLEFLQLPSAMGFFMISNFVSAPNAPIMIFASTDTLMLTPYQPDK